MPPLGFQEIVMIKTVLCFLLFACGTAQAGELYRWVDQRGVVSYSDQPPPPSAKKAQKLKGKGNVIEVDKESYELKQAKNLSPVTLYATACGQLCDQATDFLKQRGIPYTAKDPSNKPEIALELKKLTGAVDVPVIVVGGSAFKGFDAATWNRMLDVANYPKAGEAKGK
ncbi:MAG: glutaredoxin family protein [Hydrogenophilales bacterium CG_4_10_14_3_um_filter_63_21]|nr:MAG: glutaredoxin family protein [Hydrogenophilales bacterium CG_4_10_14_3_um_filter_63_21]